MNTGRSLVARVVRHRTIMALGVLCTLGAAATAEGRAIRMAPAPEDQAPPVVTYASNRGGPRTVSVPIPGTGLVRGKSTLVIDAPIDKVRATVLDFAHYAEFMPHYRKCKMLGRTQAGGHEVYMEVIAINGLVTMWARVEVTKATTVDGVEIHETKFLEGNVKDLRATWRLRKIDDASTEVTLEVFLHPRLPLPDSMINKENLGGSADAVLAVKKRVTGR